MAGNRRDRFSFQPGVNFRPRTSNLKRNKQIAQAIRATAYFLWEQDGRPAGMAFDYWLRAKQMHLRELAYDRWLAEGSPHGRDLDIWVQISKEIDES